MSTENCRISTCLFSVASKSLRLLRGLLMRYLLVALLALLSALALGAGAHVEQRFERPAVFRFGDSVVEIERALEGQCTQRELRSDDPVFLLNVRKLQQQID